MSSISSADLAGRADDENVSEAGLVVARWLDEPPARPAPPTDNAGLLRVRPGGGPVRPAARARVRPPGRSATNPRMGGERFEPVGPIERTPDRRRRPPVIARRRSSNGRALAICRAQRDEPQQRSNSRRRCSSSSALRSARRISTLTAEVAHAERGSDANRRSLRRSLIAAVPNSRRRPTPPSGKMLNRTCVDVADRRAAPLRTHVAHAAAAACAAAARATPSRSSS